MNLTTKILSLSALCLSVFADQAPTLQTAPVSTQTDPNPSARWGTSDSGNFFIQGEVLWIKPLGLNFASTKPSTTSYPDLPSYFTNEFTTGERVAIGYNTSYDGWDAVLEYTGFSYNHNNGSYNDIEGIEANGTLKHTIYFNQGDLDFGRMMKISRKVKMRPHVGARVLWLNEKSAFTKTGLTTSQAQRLKNTMGGLEIGVDSVWMFAKEFGVYANLGLSSLLNQHKMIVSGTNENNITTNYGSKIVLGADVKIGIRWDKNFSDDSYHFGINFGYEQHSLINTQGSSFEQVGAISSMGYPFVDSDFTWQAIALGARFDF